MYTYIYICICIYTYSVNVLQCNVLHTSGTCRKLYEAHLQEVRLLQRGLQARGNGKMRSGATGPRPAELQNPQHFFNGTIWKMTTTSTSTGFLKSFSYWTEKGGDILDSFFCWGCLLGKNSFLLEGCWFESMWGWVKTIGTHFGRIWYKKEKTAGPLVSKFWAILGWGFGCESIYISARLRTNPKMEVWKSSRLFPALGNWPLWVSNVAVFRDDLHMAHECNHFFGHEDPTILAILAIYFSCENQGTKLMEWQWSTPDKGRQRVTLQAAESW